MKYIKMLGLAAVAAAALMSFLGAATASATVLCESTPAAGTDCATKVAAGTVFHFTQDGTSLLLKTGGGVTIATCTESTVRGTTENTGSTTETVGIQLSETADLNHLTGNVTGLGFGTCSTTVKALKAGTMEVHHIAGTDNGTVTSSGAEVTINFLGVSCIFKTNATDVGVLTGKVGAASTFDVEAIIPSPTGGFCPASGIWSGNYIQTAPTNTFGVIAAG